MKPCPHQSLPCVAAGPSGLPSRLGNSGWFRLRPRAWVSGPCRLTKALGGLRPHPVFIDGETESKVGLDCLRLTYTWCLMNPIPESPDRLFWERLLHVICQDQEFVFFLLTLSRGCRSGTGVFESGYMQTCWMLHQEAREMFQNVSS